MAVCCTPKYVIYSLMRILTRESRGRNGLYKAALPSCACWSTVLVCLGFRVWFRAFGGTPHYLKTQQCFVSVVFAMGEDRSNTQNLL